jgi:Zn-dependent protease with chaperone function
LNFFDAQDRARKATRWLVVVYFVATALIVLGVTLLVGFTLFSTGMNGQRYSPGEMLSANPGPLLATAAITGLFIIGASIYKTMVLSSGGGQVARQMGGTLVPADAADPLRRRLRNVVEEMAIASGVPVPEIYVLEEEASINAFAAGYAPGDAAIAVTRGTLELLNRDELQGVIAHEFSHVLNGDMRLNIRLMGVLFGILVLGMMGRMIVRGGYHGRLVSSRRSKGAPVVLLIGLGVAILGWIGVFFARLIKAGVSRQREYLADASAVQFTRQTDGIANALKKIGGYKEASYLTAADPEEVSHMLFGSGARFTGLFATHPPLADRIRAIDPSFRESDYPQVVPVSVSDRMADDAASAMAGAAAPTQAVETADLPETVAESAGNPDAEDVAYARQLRQSIPATLYDAAHSVELAYLLVIALIIDKNHEHRDRQLRLAEEQLGAERSRIVARLHEGVSSMDADHRLALLEITFPALKLRPPAQLEYLVELASRLIDVDGRVDLYEYCFYRVLRISLGQAVNPARSPGPRRKARRELRQAATDLLTVVADYGHEDAAESEKAFDAGRAYFGKWARAHSYQSREHYTLRALERSLDLLATLNGKGRQLVLKAVTAVALHDQRVTAAETGLIRTICASLDVPLPPLVLARRKTVSNNSE